MVYGPRGGGRSMGPPWTSQRPAAGELTGARARGRSGHGGLPRRHGRQEGGAGTLVAGSPWAEGRRGGLATVGSEARRRRSVCEELGEWR